MTAISPDTPLLRNPDLIATDMDGDTVMMSMERGEYFGIGGVGSFVWSLLENPVSLNDIVEAICAEFDVDETTCRGDMEHFIAELRQHGLTISALSDCPP